MNAFPAHKRVQLAFTRADSVHAWVPAARSDDATRRRQAGRRARGNRPAMPRLGTTRYRSVNLHTHGIRPARETTRRDRRPGVGAASHHVGTAQDERAIRASTPCTNEPESSVENSFASSTASSIATAVGTSSL